MKVGAIDYSIQVKLMLAPKPPNIIIMFNSHSLFQSDNLIIKLKLNYYNNIWASLNTVPIEVVNQLAPQFRNNSDSE